MASEEDSVQSSSGSNKDVHVNWTGSSIGNSSAEGVQITCFTEDIHEGLLHFQVLRLQKQIYIWIGYNSAKFGHLYAAAPTRPNNLVSVTSLLGGGTDNSGSGIARRLALKSGQNIVLACNLPKDSPMLEATAERILVGKLRTLGLMKTKSEQAPDVSSLSL